jgi:hypothetical protein
MILEQFGLGWRDKYELRIKDILSLFPSASVKKLYRRLGMLAIEFTTLDNTEQFVLDCVSYKIERESARICEICGNNAHGIKKDPALAERMCLCWKCYAMELSSIDELTHSNESE